MFDVNSKRPAHQCDSVIRPVLPALGAGTTIYDSVNHRLQLAQPTPGSGNSFGYDSSSLSLQPAQPAPGELSSIAFDSSAAGKCVLVGLRTTYTSDNGVGERAKLISGGGTTFGFDNSTQRRVQVPTDRSTSFTHDNSSSLRLHVLPTPWPEGAAAKPCEPAAPDPLESKLPEEPKVFDHSAAKTERNRQENADLLAKIHAAIERDVGSRDHLCSILTEHPVVRKMRYKAFRRVGIELHSDDPVTRDAEQNGHLLFLQFLRGKGSPAWFAEHWDNILPTIAKVVGNDCKAAARLARAVRRDVILICDYSPDDQDGELFVAHGTNADLELDLVDQLTHMPQSWRTAFEEQRAGESLAAIAAREGCSESTIQRRVENARKWLQVKLGVYDRPTRRR